MADNVGKISLGLEVRSYDISKQLEKAAGNIGDQVKASLENTKFDSQKFSKALTAAIQKSFDALPKILDKTLEGISEAVTQTIDAATQKALGSVKQVEATLKSTINTLKAMLKNIKLPASFPVAENIAMPAQAGSIATTPRAPPIKQGVSVKLPKVDLSENVEYIKSMLEHSTREMDLFGQKASEVNEKIKVLKNEVKELSRPTGSSFMDAGNLETIKAHEIEIMKLTAEYNKLAASADKASFTVFGLEDQLKSMTDTAIKTAAAKVTLGDRIKQMVSGAVISLQLLRKKTDETGDAAQHSGGKFSNFNNMISSSLMRVMRRLFVYNLMYQGIRGLMSYMNSALQTNAAFSRSLNQVKTNLQVAFQPIYQAILPALQTFMNWLARVTTYIASFISALFGKTYQQSFQAAKGINAAKNAVAGYGAASKKAAKDAKGALMGFDELNILQKADTADAGGGAGAGAGGAAGAMVAPGADMSGVIASAEVMGKKVRDALEPVFKFVAWLKGDGKPVLDVLIVVLGSLAATFLVVKGVMLAVSVVMGILTSPITLVIAAIAALIAIGVLLWKNWDTIAKKAKLGWENVKKNITSAWNDLKNDASRIWNSVKTFFSDTWRSIKDGAALGWNNVKTNITGAWNTLKADASRIWGSVKIFFSDTWNGIKTTASTIFNNIKTTITTAFSNAWSGTKNAFSGVKTFFNGIWTSIKSAFGSVTTWFRSQFSNAWNAVKNVFSSGGKIFTGIKDGISSTFKTIVNGLINGVNRIIRTPFNAINTMLNRIRNVGVMGLRPFQSLWGYSPISVPQIPRLAKGGIIDGPTLAMVGDNPNAKVDPEVVAPLSKLKAMLAEIMQAQNQNGNGNETPLILQFIIDGKMIFETVVSEAQRKNARAGKTVIPIVLG